MFFLWWSWYSIACRGEPLINSLVKEKWPAYWALLPIGVWQVGWFEWRKIDCIRELDSTKKKKELQGFMTVELSINLSKWVISFAMLFCPWIDVVESLANGLISGKDYLKLLNCFQEMPMPLLKLILVMRLIQLMESIWSCIDQQYTK